MWGVPDPWGLPLIVGKGGLDKFSRISRADSVKILRLCDPLALFSRVLPSESGKGFGVDFFPFCQPAAPLAF